MKDIHSKLRRYSTAVGALLAVSATANAAIIPGAFNAGHPELDKILDEDHDVVFIDINNDGSNDFYGFMSSWSSGSSSYRAMVFGTYSSSIGFVAMDYSYGFSVNKFGAGDQIGPSFSEYGTWGLIGGFTGGHGGDPAPQNAPLGAYFDWDGDHGFIGVGLGAPGSAQYGWIEMDLRTNSESIEFIACALETTPNTGITAGHTVPLLPIASAAGLGLVGLMAAMKRRKKNATI